MEGVTQPQSAANADHEPFTHPRHKLPHCSSFNGDRKEFPAWYLEISNKLHTDGPAIGSPRDQWNYIYAALGPKAKNTVLAFAKLGGSNAQYDYNEFLSYLETNYSDPNSDRRALDKLRTIKQKDNESFALFLPRFERELADSGGVLWPDQIKINYLEGALNKELSASLISTEIPADYNGYKIQCLKIGSKLDGFKYRYGNRHSSNSTTRREKSTEKVVTYAAVADDNAESMDWESTQATKVFKLTDPHLSAQLTRDNKRLKGKRAKWVSNDEFKARLREKRCIRCGRTYCKKEICPLEAPIKPGSTTRANKAIPVMQASVDTEDTDEGDSQDSENE
jgi:hypothetical protein